MLACRAGAELRLVRQLLAAGVDAEACGDDQETALHFAAALCSEEIVRELIFEHNANMFAVDDDGNTPFDWITQVNLDGRIHAFLLDCYGNKLTADHGGLAVHAILSAAEYLVAENDEFHPPLNPLRIHLPLGKLTLQHFRTLLLTLDAELIRNRDQSGKLPIHMTCRNNAPAEVLALIVEIDPATLHMAGAIGALPLHVCCCNVVDDASVRYLVEHGGVGTLAARNQSGELPLHVLCRSTNPSLRTVQYMIQSFSGSVAARTNAGQYPFMIAACELSTASLSVVYELVRTNPDLLRLS